MLEVTSIIVMSIVLLCLTILMVTLFIKHLNVMYVFIEEMLKAQNSLYKELQAIKLDIANHTKLKKLRDVDENYSYEDIEEGSVNMRMKEAIERNNTYDISRIGDSDSSMSELDSTEVTEEELEDLIKGKELVFGKEVNIKPGDMTSEININI